jgi:hypothetical protein
MGQTGFKRQGQSIVVVDAVGFGLELGEHLRQG